MHSVTIERPAEWSKARLYVLSDLHIGDKHSDREAIEEHIKTIYEDEFGLVILNGDLMNTATRSSISDVYGETLKPSEQLETTAALLDPIKDKIIGATSGNHEARIYKADGVDMTRLLCRELGVADVYAPEGVLMFLKFGQGALHGGRQASKLIYTIYATHGSGGGRKEGAKAVRLADMASLVDADIYIHSHTHLPMVMKESFFRVDVQNGKAVPVSKLFVNTSASLTYGGYGQSQEFKPACLDCPVIALDGLKKRSSATL